MSNAIPVVDFSPFRSGDVAVRKRVADELGAAAQQWGFAVIGGHGMPAALGEALHDVGLRFFGLPLAEKMTVRRPKNDQNRGYIPFGEETLVRMAGGDGPADVKEVFAIGPDQIPDTPYFTGPGSYPSFAANLWPEQPADIRATMLGYWRGMEQVMRMVGQALALALDLDEGFFDDVLDHTHTSQLRLLHYPPLSQAVAPGQLRAGEHTDVGMMTILRNDPAPGGLQVMSPEGDWIDAPDVPDAFILNIGDLLMRWSNDRLLSTRHRVAVPPLSTGVRSRRLSIGYFVGPRYNALVECLPTCHGPGHPAKYAPVSVHDYRTARFAAGAGDNKPFRAA